MKYLLLKLVNFINIKLTKKLVFYSLRITRLDGSSRFYKHVSKDIIDKLLDKAKKGILL